MGPEEWLTHPGTVGRAVMGRIRVCDESGEELPAGEAGIVYFERDKAPFAYHNDAEKTRSAQHPKHPAWTALGDVGHVDEEGIEGDEALADELMAYACQHLAAYKCPRSIDFERELPRLSTGKLYKRLLKDRYWGRGGSKIVQE